MKGNIAEARAVAFLEDHGFTILDRNIYSRFGEIEKKKKKDRVVHFIEVKGGEGEPVYRITPAKLSKIIKTATIYMQKRRIDADFCLSAVIVTDKIELLENITV